MSAYVNGWKYRQRIKVKNEIMSTDREGLKTTLRGHKQFSDVTKRQDTPLQKSSKQSFWYLLEDEIVSVVTFLRDWPTRSYFKGFSETQKRSPFGSVPEEATRPTPAEERCRTLKHETHTMSQTFPHLRLLIHWLLHFCGTRCCSVFHLLLC